MVDRLRLATDRCADLLVGTRVRSRKDLLTPVRVERRGGENLAREPDALEQERQVRTFGEVVGGDPRLSGRSKNTCIV